MFGALRPSQSIATRLVLSAIACSLAVLVVAGFILSNIYRRTTQEAFDQRLDAYLRSLVADISAPADDKPAEPGQLGEPQFDLPNSGWYWQITRVDTDSPEIRTSRSLFAQELPKLSELGVPAGIGGTRRASTKGPDNQAIRVLEREIEVGDSSVYLERRLTRPRHVEVQLLGDHHGTVLPFVERECSIQRRHQKVVEESPSLAVTPAIRAAMTSAEIGRAHV